MQQRQLHYGSIFYEIVLVMSAIKVRTITLKSLNHCMVCPKWCIVLVKRISLAR